MIKNPKDADQMYAILFNRPFQIELPTLVMGQNENAS